MFLLTGNKKALLFGGPCYCRCFEYLYQILHEFEEFITEDGALVLLVGCVYLYVQLGLAAYGNVKVRSFYDEPVVVERHYGDLACSVLFFYVFDFYDLRLTFAPLYECGSVIESLYYFHLLSVTLLAFILPVNSPFIITLSAFIDPANCPSTITLESQNRLPSPDMETYSVSCLKSATAFSSTYRTPPLTSNLSPVYSIPLNECVFLHLD